MPTLPLAASPHFSFPPPPGGGRPSSAATTAITNVMPRKHFPVVYLLFLIVLHVVVSSADEESETLILLRFKNSLRNTDALSDWDPSRPPCGAGSPPWTGIICGAGGKVSGLKLENMALEGTIDVGILTGLRDLRSVSFMRNNFEGNLPEFSKLGSLKAVYLSHNRFSGEILEGTFAGMESLKKLHLADNRLTGRIPDSLVALPRLMELVLDRNELEGGIPNFPAGRLEVFNVSHNKLSGEIPPGLSNFDVSLFAENRGLCGGKLGQCSPSQTPSHSPDSKLPSVALTILIAAAALAFVAFLVPALILCCLIRQVKKFWKSAPKDAATSGGADVEEAKAADVTATPTATPPVTTGNNTKQSSNKLTFIREGGSVVKFDLQDLLGASAENLGHGILGSSYKAALKSNAIVVVKRFKRTTNANREEFNEHMRRLGRLDHENVNPIVAFYYRKEEKLLVTAYAANSSLAAQIHCVGIRGGQSRPLDWATRLGIVKGIAQGLKYLHTELPSLTPPHGHLKSSNIVLDGKFKPLLTDYGLIPILRQDFAQQNMVAFKSPEYSHRRKLTRKTDVWCFGIVILEILTGKPPGGGSDLDMAKWIELIVQNNEMGGGGGAEMVFDRNMPAASHAQGEMAKLLKIGLACCQEKPEARPDIEEVVKMLDEVKETELDDEFYSTIEESEIRSSRGSDDFRTINFRSSRASDDFKTINF